MSAFPDWSPGEIVTAAKLDLYTTNLTARCQVYDASQTLTDNTLTTIVFDGAEELDPQGWHSTGTNPSRVTPTIAGWYRATAWIALVSAASTVTRMQVRLLKNGTATHLTDAYPGAVSLSHAAQLVTPFFQMNGTTDYVEMQGYQDDSGGTARAVESRFTVVLVQPT